MKDLSAELQSWIVAKRWRLTQNIPVLIISILSSIVIPRIMERNNQTLLTFALQGFAKIGKSDYLNYSR
jgi:hypothetical protein